MSITLRQWNSVPVRPSISVVLSTYNQPEWLEKSLLGYARQHYTDFELVLADDGSDGRTDALLDRLAPQLPYPLQRVWHPDDGFQKCVILNRALECARADYLVFSDGDCVPRADFLGVHHALREPGRFLSGGYCKLPMPVSKAIDAASIERGDHVNGSWLRRFGDLPGSVARKLEVKRWQARLLDALSPARPSWNGHNASGWREHLFDVNGFDERMQYGGQDREFGERLENRGVRGKRIRHRAIVVHLDHPRGYATADSIARNRAIRDETRRHHKIWADQGLQAGPRPVHEGARWQPVT